MIAAWLASTLAWDDLRARFESMFEASQWGFVNLVLALLVILIGWLVATLAGGLVRWLLRVTHFDSAVRRLVGSGAGPEPSVIGGLLVQATLLAVAVLYALDVLGFQLAASLTDRLADVLPRLVAAAVLLAIGMMVGTLLGSITRRAVETSGLRGARWRGQLVAGVVTTFAVLLALDQLGIAAQFVLALVIVVLSGAALALGLAFGLGCRDLARDFVIEFLRSHEDEGPRRPA